MSIAEQIQNGQAALGIELGSTRIKAVLIGADHMPVASGGFGWENSLKDGVWTYPLEDVWTGIQASFAELQKNVQAQHGVTISRLKGIGFSAMMHGYMVFDAEGNQLVPFRTWRNNRQGAASEKLTELFDYPIPQRWSIAHLYQAILNREEHVGRIAHATTLAGYVHWKLTGRKTMGVGEASGMFPIDIQTQDFHAALLEKFDALIRDEAVGWKLRDLLPEVLSAGEPAGELTAEGAALLDPAGNLQPGIPFCPPEGDAGTGMVATNSVEVRTGNVSAGTSVFAMIVLEKELSKAHHEIDLVTTPDGKLVGMAHSNNCTSDCNAWIGLLGEAAKALGANFSTDDLYATLLRTALTGDAECGGLLTYGYVSGEHITGFSEGRPLFARSSDSRFTLANFMRAHLFSALCALRTGLDILMVDEGVAVDEIRGHGGLFKTADVGQRVMAAATNAPVSVLETAGEGGAWGIALLAAYLTRENRQESLPEFLKPIFAGSMGAAVQPDPADVAGFNLFFQRYHEGLAIERAAIASLS
ncbi:MAG TPA: FGGY-family carbohydrate kinase [Chthoniobacterales bacterium]